MQFQLPDFSRLHILVVGDVMLDRYWQGATSRISPEAPVPIINVGETIERAGGAGNVARNITAMGAYASLLGIVGDDDAATTLQSELIKDKVDCHLRRSAEASTITKLRVMSRHQQLIRLDFEDSFKQSDTTYMHDNIRQYASECDVVILSDYGKGTLSNIPELVKVCQDLGKPVLIDPKLDGDEFINAYRNATLITPNYSEFESVVGVCVNEDEIRSRGCELVQNMNLDALLVTRSDKGMMLFQKNGEVIPLPTQAKEVYDVTGAGDTVISMMALAIAAGMRYTDAIRMANTAAGIVVGKLGTATVSLQEMQAVRNISILSPDDLIQRVALARNQGERIVMTNGCFDILHAGHADCLTKAAALGDRLIVAVNSDNSVRRLKGLGRPVVPLNQRMALLSALASVDWVVAFSEDTPEDLICRIKPDVLVKGGDYLPDQIAGGNCVTQNGGDVVVIELKEGCSTSRIVETIKNLQ